MTVSVTGLPASSVEFCIFSLNLQKSQDTLFYFYIILDLKGFGENQPEWKV